ncbi:MAG TPA: hypothetical protein VD999_00475 [Vitreimonas sp.]|nr:hypothetical protein [Vitreimonas sp.]
MNHSCPIFQSTLAEIKAEVHSLEAELEKMFAHGASEAQVSEVQLRLGKLSDRKLLFDQELEAKKKTLAEKWVENNVDFKDSISFKYSVKNRHLQMLVSRPVNARVKNYWPEMIITWMGSITWDRSLGKSLKNVQSFGDLQLPVTASDNFELTAPHLGIFTRLIAHKTDTDPNIPAMDNKTSRSPVNINFEKAHSGKFVDLQHIESVSMPELDQLESLELINVGRLEFTKLRFVVSWMMIMNVPEVFLPSLEIMGQSVSDIMVINDCPGTVNLPELKTCLGDVELRHVHTFQIPKLTKMNSDFRLRGKIEVVNAPLLSEIEGGMQCEYMTSLEQFLEWFPTLENVGRFYIDSDDSDVSIIVGSPELAQALIDRKNRGLLRVAGKIIYRKPGG